MMVPTTIAVACVRPIVRVSFAGTAPTYQVSDTVLFSQAGDARIAVL